MMLVTIEAAGQPSQTVRIARFPCRIGRGRDCELPLSGWRVGRLHAEVRCDGRSARIVDRGTLGGTRINGERIAESGPLTDADLIEIGGHRLRIQLEHLPGSGPQVPATETVLQPVPAAAADAVPTAAVDVGWRRLVHRRLLQTIDLRRRDPRSVDNAALRAEIRAVIEQLLDASTDIPPSVDRAQLVSDVLDEALGLGPLERLLEDPDISEIMVNAADEIWVERAGRLHRHSVVFSDDDAIRNIIDRIVAPLGRRIDEASPMVDARLVDGSRVNAVLPPLAVRGPTLTIRRFNRQLLALDDLHRCGSASLEILGFLRICVQHRRNIVISGGTGSGKTTLLNVLSNLIPDGERIITIEDSAELSLRHEHLVRLEARPPNVEGRGEVSIRDLARNALRMRPDRIVIGECRGAEALDMLQAMNTGHDGSLTTVHANSPRDVVSRLEVMSLMAGIDLPVQAIREQIASAVDVIVHQARFADGVRRIASVMEVTGIEAGRVQMLELFRFEPHPGVAAGGFRHAADADGNGSTFRRGRFRPCDAIPTFYESLREAGAELDLSIFAGSRS